jgi:hypothetical protein
MVRREEGDHWISGQASDPQQTANHCGGRTFVGGLNYKLRRLDVGLFVPDELHQLPWPAFE